MLKNTAAITKVAEEAQWSTAEFHLLGRILGAIQLNNFLLRPAARLVRAEMSSERLGILQACPEGDIRGGCNVCNALDAPGAPHTCSDSCFSSVAGCQHHCVYTGAVCTGDQDFTLKSL